MSLRGKPLWLEGMLIQPQHFQQLGRWVEHTLEGRVAGLNPHGWGIRQLEIDRDLLALGRLQVTRLSAVMPDGTVIDAPDTSPPPPAREVPKNLRAALVKVALPLAPNDGRELSEDGTTWQRYAPRAQPVRDNTREGSSPREIRVGTHALRLVFQGESEDEVVTLPIARVREVEATGAVTLSPSYVPPCLDLHAASAFLTAVNEVRGLLKSRADALAVRVDPSQGSSDASGLVDLLTLSIVNGHEAVFEHFARGPGPHPETVFRALLHLCGELATFTPTRRPPTNLPAYQHDELEGVVRPVLEVLRSMLSVVIERNIVPLPLQERGYGISTATIGDRTLFQDSRFYLAATASVPSETLRSLLPTQLKIGSVEQIRDLVNLQLPGIGVRVLSVVPRELPFLQNAVYFELDQSSELWRPLTRSAAFALHVSGEYDNLNMQLWAVRGRAS